MLLKKCKVSSNLRWCLHRSLERRYILVWFLNLEKYSIFLITFGSPENNIYDDQDFSYVIMLINVKLIIIVCMWY